MRVQNDFASDIDAELSNPTDKRMFAIAAAFREGYTVDQVWKLTNIDKWFLTKLYGLHDFHEYLRYALSLLHSSQSA